MTHGQPEKGRCVAATGFALFDTAIGRCAIAWGSRGVLAVQLPEASDDAARARLLQQVPGADEGTPPAQVQRAIDGIVALLEGQVPDFDAVPLDMERVPPFHRRVYEIARTIPPGTTLTYGEIAAWLGAPGAARAVGQALGRNPFAIIVPCHRVLAAGGKVGGFSAQGGSTTKLRLLAIEGAHPTGAPTLFHGNGTFSFDPRVAVAHLQAADAQLAGIIDLVGPFGMRPKTASSIFSALVEAIVYQQLSGRAAATIYARVCALFPQAPAGPTAEQFLLVPGEQLRAAGLSRSKILSVRDLAERTVTGEIPTLAEVQGMEDEAIIERLIRVRGVGRWTAQMLLMFRLGRPDVLPVDDYGIRKGFAVAFDTGELPTPAEVEEHGILWKPYRTVASWYLWRAVDPAISEMLTSARPVAVE
jgi:methylated-DNA-[protein]-cysteine S-methyltransferase